MEAEPELTQQGSTSVELESIPEYLLRKARVFGGSTRHLYRSRAVGDFLWILLFILFVALPVLALTWWLFTH